jgi:hypothetical protein
MIAMKKYLLFILLLISLISSAQNDRVNDYNNTNWFQTLNTVKLNKQWSLHLEYQWRRTDGLKYWQQSLLRIGANYKLNDNVTLHAGYAWAETFPYGDHPIAASGTFPEHRLYEQLNLRQPLGKLTLTHRFRIEQRWLGRVVNTNGQREVEEWNFLHRFRYQFRATHPLSKRTTQQPYLVAADELFIGAGKNVGVNIFDQNRIFLLFGYKFNDKLSLEAGYFNQTLQQGRRVNTTTIMQRNNGIVLSSYLNL